MEVKRGCREAAGAGISGGNGGRLCTQQMPGTKLHEGTASRSGVGLLGCDFGRERECAQQNRQPESKHRLRISVWGQGFGSCGFVVAGRNASNFLALFLPRILAL